MTTSPVSAAYFARSGTTMTSLLTREMTPATVAVSTGPSSEALSRVPRARTDRSSVGM